jgi:hypothetical protein
MEGTVELDLRHLVVHGASSGVVGPPCAGVTTQLLHGEEGLLNFCAALESKLGLNHPKPVISLKRLSCLGEERWMGGREVTIGGQSRSRSISCPIATMSRVGHELLQQLSLLISGLKDRDDGLSKTWRRRQVPVSLSILGSNSSVVSVHHSIIQTSYR